MCVHKAVPMSMVIWSTMEEQCQPLLLYLPPVERDSLRWAMGIPELSFWACQECKALVTLHLGQSSRSCLPRATMRDEVAESRLPPHNIKVGTLL